MAAHKPEKLFNGGTCKIPKDIAVCPECGGRLYAESTEWQSDTGKPTIGGLYIQCEHESFKRDDDHRRYFCDWYPTMVIIETWCGAVSDYS